MNIIYKNFCLILIIICMAFICYANSLSAPFIWDDEVLILRNHYIRSWRYLWPIFTTSHFQGGGEGGNFYRPLQIISYALDFSLWKLKSFGFHLTNLALHCLAAIAVYFLITKISLNNFVAFLTALFFVTHPVHTEAVTYIAGRADSLAAVFLLFLLFCFTNISATSCTKRYTNWIISTLLYIFALLSKESALIFLPLAIFYGICFIPKREIKFWVPVYLTLLLISLAYVYIRVTFLAFPKAASLSLIAQAPLGIRLFTIPKICASYLGLLILPVYLHMERHFLVTSMKEPYFWLGLFVLFLTILFLKLTYRRQKATFFYIGWFVITLIPVLNIIPLNATMAEHWLYLPAVGFWAMLATIGVQFFQKASFKNQKILIVLGCLLFLFYCTRTIMRNFQWRNPFKLYAHDLEYSANSFLLHNNLGVELFRKAKINEAGQEFQKAVQICPRYATSHNNLGAVLEEQIKMDEAIAHYQAAIRLNNYILAYGNLGRVYLKIKQPDKAAQILEQGESFYPEDAEVIYYLAIAYLKQGKFTQAKEKFMRVSQLVPHYKDIDLYLQKLKRY